MLKIRVLLEIHPQPFTVEIMPGICFKIISLDVKCVGDIDETRLALTW